MIRHLAQLVARDLLDLARQESVPPTQPNSEAAIVESMEQRDLQTRFGPGVDQLGVINTANGFQNAMLDADAPTNSSAAAQNTEIDFVYGLAGDKVLAGNWNGTGSSLVVVRQPGQNNAPNDGLLHWYFDDDGDADAERHVAYGFPGDTPIVGDWNGDGKDDIGVTRAAGRIGVPNDGLLHWLLDTNGDFAFDTHRKFGFAADTPVAGNFHTTPGDELGVVRPDSSGLYRWYLSTGASENQFREERFGLKQFNHIPVVGDWDDDGRDNVGVAQKNADGTLTWHLNTDADADPEVTRTLNTPGQIPVVGQWGFAEFEFAGAENARTTRVNFGAVPVGQSQDRAFTILNRGTDLLTTTMSNLPAGFSIVNRLALSDGGESFTIRFAPTEDRVYSGTVTIQNNDGNESPFWLELVGAASVPEITVGRQTGSQLVNITDGSQTPITLESALQGDASPVATFLIENDGDRDLQLGQPQLPAGFRLAEPFNTQSLARDATALLKVAYDTTVVHTINGRIVIPNNDANESPFDFAVRAVVAPKVPEITVSLGSQNLTDGQAAAIAFGQLLQGATSGTERTLNLKNDGSGPLTFTSPTLPLGFSNVTTPAGRTLQPGESFEYRIRIETATTGTKSGVLRIHSNDADESSFDLNLTGRVDRPFAEINYEGIADGQTPAISFGDVPLFGSATVDPRLIRTQAPRRSIVVKNDGNIPLQLGAATVTGPFTLIAGPASTVQPGQTTTIEVAMPFDSVGAKAGQIRFSTNDSNENPVTIQLTGRVVAPEVSIQIGGTTVVEGTTGRLNLGAWFVNAGESPRTITVSNTGTAPLVLSNLFASGPFSIAGNWTQPILPGQSRALNVSISTTQLGTKEGSLTFNSNDWTGNESTIRVDLKGRTMLPPNRIIGSHAAQISADGEVRFSGAGYSEFHIEPPNGDVPFNTHTTITFKYNGQWNRAHYAGFALRRLTIVGSSNVAVLNWTGNVVQSNLPISSRSTSTSSRAAKPDDATESAFAPLELLASHANSRAAASTTDQSPASQSAGLLTQKAARSNRPDAASLDAFLSDAQALDLEPISPRV